MAFGGRSGPKQSRARVADVLGGAAELLLECGRTDPFRAAVNTIRIPPGEYDRKVETQRN